MRTTIAAVAASLVAAPAYAEPFGVAELYLSVPTIDVEASDDYEGGGGGVRFATGMALGSFVQLEAQYVPTDARFGAAEQDLDLTDLRAGFGYAVPIARARSLIRLRAEYIALMTELDAGGTSSEDTAEGYGLHAEYLQNLPAGLQFNLSVGWIDIEDSDGFEGLAGVGWAPGPVGLFAEYRYTDLESENGATLKIRDVRGGLRFAF